MLQWNCHGLRSKEDELSQMINNYNPCVIAIQETKFGNNTNFNLPHYTCHCSYGHFNVTPHGGVALFIHESMPFQTIDLNCALQAVAAVVQLDVPITKCSLYASRNHNLTQESLSEVLDQLPAPMVILGDFNSYNTLWGCRTTDLRGRIVEDVVSRHQLIILNTESNSDFLQYRICY